MTKINEASIALNLLRGEWYGGEPLADRTLDDSLRMLFERFEGLAIVVVQVERRDGCDATAPRIVARTYSDFTADYPLRAIVGRMVREAAGIDGRASHAKGGR